MRLPFDLLLPRIEALEHQIEREQRAVLAGQPAATQAVLTVAADPGLRQGIDSLTRAWLRLSNDLSVLAARVPEVARQAVDERVAALERAATATEARAAVERLSGTVETLARQSRLLHDEVAARDAAVAGPRERIARPPPRAARERAELARRERRLEPRHGARDGAQAARPRILSPGKVAAARAAGGPRLYLGRGDAAPPGYINVDCVNVDRIDPETGARGIDVIADAGALPFEPGSVEEIVCADLVEHLPRRETARRLLPYWRGLLRPGGTLRAITPDGAAMLAACADGGHGLDELRDRLFGGQDGEADIQHTMFTPETLTRLVERAGFAQAAVPARGRRNGGCLEFELVARAPGGDAAADGAR